MSQEDVLDKIDSLVRHIAEHQGMFQERDVVYLVVEAYKVKERDLSGSDASVRDQLTHLAFFRDWIVHTNINNQDWFDRRGELMNPDGLLSDLSSVITNTETRHHIETMWDSFIKSLKKVLQDQGISLRN
ncbi:hypothetical protein CL652_02570 [bacterium]|nr:hypothetical protein [bacterium]|tara:strand:- start:15644 stop:16033 length:390 start_codon:yes stop_codon:yes gene_type:complete